MAELYIDFCKKIKIKVVSSKSVKWSISNYLKSQIVKKCRPDYTITLIDQYNQVTVPSKAKIVESTISANYYCWKDGNVQFCYTEGNKYTSPHFIIKCGQDITLFANQNKEDVLIKIIRELCMKSLVKEGYVPFHASAVCHKGKANVFFGQKNSGKTTSLLLSTTYLQSNPMSNDLTFIKKCKNNKYSVFGFFYRIKFDNRAYELLPVVKAHAKASDFTRVALTPLAFEKKFGVRWVYEAPLNAIYHVSSNYTDSECRLKKLDDTEKFESRKNIYDDCKWGDFLNLGIEVGSSDMVFNSMDVMELSGDIRQFFLLKSVKKLLRKFPTIKNDYAIQKSQLGTGNNFILVSRGNKFFVKSFSERNIYDNIANEEKAIQQLSEYKFPIPRYLTTTDNRIFAKDGCLSISIQKWINAESVDSYDCTDRYMYRSATILAKINKILDGLNFAKRMLDTFDNMDQAIDATNKLLKRLEKSKNLAYSNEIKGVLISKIDLLSKLKEYSFPDINKFTFRNSHGDYSIIQILRKNGKAYKVTDFSRAGCYPIIWEIIRSFSYADKDAKMGKINKTKLEKYIKNYEKVLPLSSFDKENMYLLYGVQILKSNFGFYNYIDNNDDSNLAFAFWRFEFAKTLLKEAGVFIGD